MAKSVKVKKKPSASVKGTSNKASVKSVATKKKPARSQKCIPNTGGCGRDQRWTLFRISSAFVASSFGLERMHAKQKIKVDMQEQQYLQTKMLVDAHVLALAKNRLSDLEKKLAQRREKEGKARGDPTGRVLNLFMDGLPEGISVSGRTLSGEIEMTADMLTDATLGDLEMQVSERLGWVFADSFDCDGSNVPKHSAIKDFSGIVMKELALGEFQGPFPPSGLSESARKRLATNFLREHKLPIHYAQAEHWEDSQGVGGDGDIALDFRTSNACSLLKFGKLFDLQGDAGWKQCHQLASSAKYNAGCGSSIDYFRTLDGCKIKDIDGHSQLEIITDELRLHEILMSLADEAGAFAETPFDSITDGEGGGGQITNDVEYQRRRKESCLVMKAALHWIEQFCTSSSISATYVRLEQWRRTFYHEDNPEESDIDKEVAGNDDSIPGRSIVEATGVLFLRTGTGMLARLSLAKHLEDFTRGY